jgi:DNA-binding transcriptional ArsR family regulator
MAEKFRALGDSTRLRILRALMSEGEMNVSQIVAATNQTTANASRHLKQLAATGLLARRKVGAFVRYRLEDPVVERICTLVCDSLLGELELQLKRERSIGRRTRRK